MPPIHYKKKINLKHTLFIYYRLMSQNLRAIIEYQSDFLIAVIAAFFTQAVGFIFLWVLFANIPQINGWSMWEVVFLYAMIYFTEGFVSFFFEGVWRINFLVNAGEFDRLLLRPLPVTLQVLSYSVGINGLGNLTLGSVLIVCAISNVAVSWTLGKVAFLLIVLISTVIIRCCISFSANCQAFWNNAPTGSFPNMIHNISDFAKYPLTLFPSAVKVLVCVIVPYTFISYFPASVLFDKDLSTVGLFTPIIAVYCLIISRIVFNIGLKKYESTGH